jgi:sigma-B regulation protein RsbU (phosphoserine phosphatase)
LRLLHELGRAFAARTDLDELCGVVTRECAGVLRAEGASILLLDPATNELYFPYVANADPEAAARLRRLRFPADHGIAGHTLAHGKAVRVDDTTTDVRFYGGADQASGVMTRSVLAAPLASERGTIGVLQVVNRIDGGSFSDDDLAFLEALAGSVAVAVENARLLAETRAQLEALQRATEEHAALEALRRELDIAREIQQSILPRRFPEHSQIDLFATMLPARDVGGDFYDFFALDAQRLGLVIGDVSGKGMPAALFMAVSRTLMKATALSGLGPAACLERVNALLLTENTSDMFVTLFYAIVDLRSGELIYSSGGHNPPFVIRAGADVETVAAGGALLGVLDSPHFSEHRLRLALGDTLLLYTDGVTEAADAADLLYGEGRVAGLLAGACSGTSEQLVHALIGDVERHSEGIAQSDDITVLAMRYLGPR